MGRTSHASNRMQISKTHCFRRMSNTTFDPCPRRADACSCTVFPDTREDGKNTLFFKKDDAQKKANYRGPISLLPSQLKLLANPENTNGYEITILKRCCYLSPGLCPSSPFLAMTLSSNKGLKKRTITSTYYWCVPVPVFAFMLDCSWRAYLLSFVRRVGKAAYIWDLPDEKGEQEKSQMRLKIG